MGIASGIVFTVGGIAVVILGFIYALCWINEKFDCDWW